MNDRPAPDWAPPSRATGAERAAIHADLRARCPVPYAERPGERGGYWSLMRYADIAAAVRDPETFSNGASVRFSGRRPPLESDPPEHGQFRKALMPFVAPARMQAMEPAVRAMASELVAPLLSARGGDAARAIARPLPVRVLLAWIGQPREDWSRIKGWCDDTLPRHFKDDADRARFRSGDEALWAYSWEVVSARRAGGADPSADPVSALLAASLDGRPMPDELAAGVVRLLVAAGHDSTSIALGLCLYHFARHPEDQARVRADRALLRKAIEEILRLESPVVAMPRILRRDVTLNGRELKAGERVLLNWASANRDPAAFADPDRCILDRRPNPHMVFGDGIHLCLGAPLARMELRVALETLLDATAAFGLAGEPALQEMHHNGIESLPLWIEPAGRA